MGSNDAKQAEVGTGHYVGVEKCYGDSGYKGVWLHSEPLNGLITIHQVQEGKEDRENFVVLMESDIEDMIIQLLRAKKFIKELKTTWEKENLESKN